MFVPNCYFTVNGSHNEDKLTIKSTFVSPKGGSFTVLNFDQVLLIVYS